LTVLTWIFIGIEAVSVVALIFLVLLHSGRGGGISAMMGGSFNQMASGSTVVERNLDRITIAVALVFAFATLTLDLRLQ
jgi:preprotein translocase subunit SecG